MPTCARLFHFDYAHRVLNHESKCKHLHGHRGVAEVTVYAPSLDPLGRVIDFGRLKEVVGKWIDDNWDHNIILNDGDPLIDGLLLSGGYTKADRDRHLLRIFGGKHPYSMAGNPTAENLARTLYKVAEERLAPLGIKVVSVKFWETPNCFAIYPDQGGDK
jgi:6-pyruvoyltetrahydropterin/6-carboxytetrahydropterin synthase